MLSENALHVAGTGKDTRHGTKPCALYKSKGTRQKLPSGLTLKLRESKPRA